MLDAFRKLDDAQVQTNPFPYICIENVFPNEICNALIREMPPLHVLTHGQALGDNRRVNFSYADAVANPAISPRWRDVLGQAVSQRFLDRILRLFEPSIREYYPDFESRFSPVSKLKAQLRPRRESWGSDAAGHDSHDPDTIRLDAQIAVNTPAITGGTSVRTPHLDRTDKIFIGLLYLRLPEDDSKGADLELLSPKEAGPLIYGHQRMLPAEQTTHVRTIPYKSNTLVLFLNTPKSLHGVSPREATPHTRYFINLVAETCEPLFEVETLPPPAKIAAASKRHQAGLLERIWRHRPGRAL